MRALNVILVGLAGLVVAFGLGFGAHMIADDDFASSSGLAPTAVTTPPQAVAQGRSGGGMPSPAGKLTTREIGAVASTETPPETARGDDERGDDHGRRGGDRGHRGGHDKHSHDKHSGRGRGHDDDRGEDD